MSQKLLDSATRTTADAIKPALKKAIEKKLLKQLVI